MVKVSYKEGKMRGSIEMACMLEGKTTPDLLRDAGAKVYHAQSKSSWVVEIPETKVLSVLQLIERTLANCIPCLGKLPKGKDKTFGCVAYYNVHLMLFWSHLYADILRKHAKVTE